VLVVLAELMQTETKAVTLFSQPLPHRVVDWEVEGPEALAVAVFIRTSLVAQEPQTKVSRVETLLVTMKVALAVAVRVRPDQTR
jgi:hypothetical protein